MRYLEKLLEGVEVEWKALGEVATINRGHRVTKRELSPEKKYPVYSGGVTPMGYFEEYNQDENTITIVKYGTAGFVNFITEKFWANDVCYCVKPSSILINKYLLYVLKNNQNHINSLATDAIPAHLPTEAISGLLIPIPPIEIQKEIVRILDTFTELTTELITELIARKKQYNYYRDQLLSFEEGKVKWKALGEVCLTISAGGDVPEKCVKGQENPTDKFPYPVYANAMELNGLYGYTDGYKIESDAVTISARGAKVGFHTIREGKFTAIIRLIVLVANKAVISTKYLNYILDITPIGGTTGGIPQLTVPTVKNIKIPIPPLKEQARIVRILDKFDTLTTSISEGLPKEIELRKKQYEYYRNMLLTFPKDNLKV